MSTTTALPDRKMRAEQLAQTYGPDGWQRVENYKRAMQ
jgi:hypothetical protein